MWLLPVFSPVARAALRVYYRFAVAGERVPRTGAVLLIANHPNSLLDPAVVVAIAGRPVRFLAKAPLFSDRQVGWLVRGAGAIPVYRRQDDAAQMERNDDTFRAAHVALHQGDAVGIFPEGISHSAPSLSPLKTGAARIALGAAPIAGAFPIVPVGLSFRDKGRFRSEALAVVGRPVEWADLAAAGPHHEPVRALSQRIEARLREVTINLERWEDAPLVEGAQEIWMAERGLALSEPDRLAGLREVGEGLVRMRSGDREDWKPLASDLARHLRLLRALGMRPRQLAQPSAGEALRWSARQILLVPALPLALLGAALYYLPYRLTGWLVERARPEPDIEATYKVLAGGALHAAWTLLLAVAAGLWGGVAAGLAVAVAAPLLGVAAVRILDAVRGGADAGRRYLVRRQRAARVARLREAQRSLAERLAELRSTVRA